MTFDEIIKLNIPRTMKLWFGDNSNPSDWNGAAVMCRDGSFVTVDKTKCWPWTHDNEDSDIIAYATHVPDTELSHFEQYLVENMAKAAHRANALPLPEKEATNSAGHLKEDIFDPDKLWPHFVQDHVGAKGFRACARSAYLSLRKTIVPDHVDVVQMNRDFYADLFKHTADCYSDEQISAIREGKWDESDREIFALLHEYYTKISMLSLHVSSQPKWCGDLTVGNMVANLLTLPFDMNLYAAYHSIMPGKESVCRVKRPTLSREKVIGQTIDPQKKDVPYSAVIWSHPQPLDSDDMVDKASKAYAPDLFSDDPITAHQAASPRTVESERQKVRDKMRLVLSAL